MNEQILIGRGREIKSIPRQNWEEQLSKVPDRMKIRLSFMTREHHRVRYFVVRTLPSSQEPIAPELISKKLKLSVARVNEILYELESKLFFLVRDKRGRVSWAFPVTVDKTAHRLNFSSGQSCYAA
jgi:hypothetical protein